jgi:hypothetical protein
MFAEIDDRREQVQDAHRETFRWIFQSDHETGFAKWLSSGDGIFWIHGKPASGKSTLIKYITQERRLRELLDVWTGSSPLVVASFYFWVAGSPLQRSLVGLYRTLLHQMLKAEEHMCRIAFPDWQRKFSDAEPTLGMLTAAVQRILTSGQLSNNFFFIIDGLDEYDRDSIGKTQLAELMLDLTRSPRVKLLLSSRPETPFKAAFQQCPTLRLEKLTEPDMSAYVNKRLWSNPAVNNISGVDVDSIREIATFILDNAQGVFLWVVLTLSIALDGISNHEDLAAVRDRVTLLPPELDEMFTHILTKRIPQHHKQEAFRCLFITFVWNSESVRIDELASLSYMVVSTARRTSTIADACALVRSTSFETLEYFRNWLASRCQGLLEASDGRHGEAVVVFFLHRTLLDYLREDRKAQALLKAGLGEGFDVYTAIMAGLICAEKLKLSTSEAGWSVFYFNMLAERSTGQSRSELLAVFDKIESIYYGGAERIEHDEGRPQRHWSVRLFKTKPPTDSSLLVWAAHCGAALFVQEAIEKGEVPDARASSRLLYYALTPLFSEKEMDETRPVEPNLAVAALLLSHGADPAYEVGVDTPWIIVLRSVVEATSPYKRTRMSKGNVDMAEAALRTLVMLAHGAPDLPRCSAQRMFYRVDATLYNASEALDRIVLARRCCGDNRIRTCQCYRAQSRRTLVMEVLDLVEATEKIDPETANSQDKNAKTRRFHKWSVKKLLPRRK